MPSIERIVTTQTPAGTVWKYLSDFRNTNEWDPGTKETTRLSGDGGAGTVYKNASKFAGRETELIYTVEEFNPPRSLSLEGKNKTITARDTINVVSDGPSLTTVTYVAKFTFHGWAKLFALFSGPFLKKLGDHAAKSMEDALDRL